MERGVTYVVPDLIEFTSVVALNSDWVAVGGSKSSLDLVGSVGR